VGWRPDHSSPPRAARIGADEKPSKMKSSSISTIRPASTCTSRSFTSRRSQSLRDDVLKHCGRERLHQDRHRRGAKLAHADTTAVGDADETRHEVRPAGGDLLVQQRVVSRRRRQLAQDEVERRRPLFEHAERVGARVDARRGGRRRAARPRSARAPRGRRRRSGSARASYVFPRRETTMNAVGVNESVTRVAELPMGTIILADEMLPMVESVHDRAAAE